MHLNTYSNAFILVHSLKYLILVTKVKKVM